MVLALAWPVAAQADGKVRMYKLNKQEQQRRLSLGRAAEKPGCHNLLTGKKVYRVAQAGFAWCSVYAKDDCAPESIVSALWTGREYRKYQIDGTQPQKKLYPGSNWMLQLDDGNIQSWYCEAE